MRNLEELKNGRCSSVHRYLQNANMLFFQGKSHASKVCIIYLCDNCIEIYGLSTTFTALCKAKLRQVVVIIEAPGL